MTDDDRKGGACGIAADRQPVGRTTEGFGVVVSPSCRGDGIFEWSGKRVLWRQPVVDAQHGMPTAVGQDAAQVVVSLEVAEHPATAMEEHEQAEVVAVVGAIQTGGHSTGIDVAGLVNRFRRGSLPSCPDLARLRRRARLEWRFAERGHRARRAIPLGDARARGDSGTAPVCPAEPVQLR